MRYHDKNTHPGKRRGSGLLTRAFFLFAAALGPGPLPAQTQETVRAVPQAALPLRRVSLYSSGVGFFSHEGSLSQGTVVLDLSFSRSAMDDALKSLTVILPPAQAGAAAPQVSARYAPPGRGDQAIPSLAPDRFPGIARILLDLRGEEAEVSAPSPIRGRILAVEYRPQGGGAMSGGGATPDGGQDVYLSLYGEAGIRVINLKDVTAIAFLSERVNGNFVRALDRIREEQNDSVRNISVDIAHSPAGTARISYVIPSPVWKVSYRLDLSGGEPFLQGWAIIDNAGDADWENVELSLVSGRPVSFMQNLYAPYHVFRPTLPLAIAGAAGAETWEGSLGAPAAKASVNAPVPRSRVAGAVMVMDDMAAEESAIPYPAPAAPSSLADGGYGVQAQGADLADQFQFTLQNPVSILSHQSSMIPLVQGGIEARRILILSGSRVQGGRSAHPATGAEIVNRTGMKLPAGPLTVYDAGSYAGDALIEFFPEDDRRLVSWGEDLSVSGSATASRSRVSGTVTVSRGVMSFRRKQVYETVYTVRNGAGQAKTIVVEHPATADTSLVEPAPEGAERTLSAWRFSRELPAQGSLSLTVREERPLLEELAIARLGMDALAAWSVDQEIPPGIRSALARAAILRREAEAATALLQERESRRAFAVQEQDRIRQNLEAAGNQSPQGQEYLRRLAAQDRELDALAEQMEAARLAARDARTVYENYVESLSFPEP